jgi:hypothetical protein
VKEWTLNSRHVNRLLVIVVAVTLLLSVATAQKIKPVTIYNTVPSSLPGNVASEGPEAYAFAELGDGIGFFASTGTIGKITVVMSSWACQSGTWQSGCVTGKNAAFNQDITFNLYAVTGNIDTGYTVGERLSSITQTYAIPYRPSATPASCSDPSEWYNKKDKGCYHGIAVPITVDFSSLAIPLPANGQLVITVAYNTTHYGPLPIGEGAACFTTQAGCPYDSLNISTDTTDGVYPTNPGYQLDHNGIFVNYTLPDNSCTKNIVTGMVEQDTGTYINQPCWQGYHPELTVVVNP